MFDLLPNQMQGFAHGPGKAFYPNMWDNYLGGLTPCLGFVARNAPDISPYHYDGAPSSTAPTVAGSPIGAALSFVGNRYIVWSGSGSFLNKFKAGGGGAGITLHAYFKYTSQPSASNMNLFCSDNGTVSSRYYGYQLYLDAYTSNYLMFRTHRGELISDPQSAIYNSPVNSLVSGKWHNVAVTFWPADYNDGEIGQYVMMNIDGTWTWPAFVYSEYDISHHTLLSSFSGASSGMSAPEMDIALLHVWNRRLPWREIDLLMADPLAMFRMRKAGGFIMGPRIVSIGGAVSRQIGRIAVAG